MLKVGDRVKFTHPFKRHDVFGRVVDITYGNFVRHIFVIADDGVSWRAIESEVSYVGH